MDNNTKTKKKWPARVFLLLAYLVPFSHLFTYYDDAITFCLTAVWVGLLFFLTLKTNNSHLIFPGHCLSFLVSLACASYQFYNAFDGLMAMALSTVPHVILTSLLLLIGHLIIAAAYKKLQASKNKKKETEN